MKLAKATYDVYVGCQDARLAQLVVTILKQNGIWALLRKISKGPSKADKEKCFLKQEKKALSRPEIY
jgi:hypothetical protein